MFKGSKNSGFTGLLILLLSQSIFAQKPDLFLLKTYEDKQDVVGWVMSEKLDGVRGFWDGRQLLTRGGKQLSPPGWFTANYPPFAIDGELWTKRGDFENITSIVRTKKPDDRWREISHQIFEVPNQSGGLLARLAVLEAYLKTRPNTPIKIIKQMPINSQVQLQNALLNKVKQGAEGLVVRNPNTPYQTGRLKSALKVKQYLDAECVVREILTGKGKYTGKMGSLSCQMIDGKMLKIGSGFSDKQRSNPPIIGSLITFKYYGLTKKGRPKYATFLHIKQSDTQ